MKIIHCCFGIEHYIDTWGYQQNLLPLYCAKAGHETVVLASNDTFPSFVKQDVIEAIKAKGNSYMNGPVRVARSSSWFPRLIHFQKAKGLCDQLEREQPDIIFFHGSFNLSLLSCIAYKKQHPEVKLYVDNHGDVMNVRASGWYRFLFFKCYWSLIHQYCQRTVDQYFGVTEGRCRFLREYLHIAFDKVSLLPIGADVDSAEEVRESREQLRARYGFANDDVIMVHGGKLDARKGTVDLIKVYRQLRKSICPNLRLVLFGKMVDERIQPMIGDDIVVYDWLSRTQTFELFKLADLAVWPIHHTTLIEDCVAAGLPYLIRMTETTQHLINSDFYLRNGDPEELHNMIRKFLQTDDKSNMMKSLGEIRDNINYYHIAESFINRA